MLDRNNETPKVTVESLLRIKRNERPDDAFWAGFDRKLEKGIVQSMVHRPSFKDKWLHSVQWARHPVGLAAVTLIVIGVVSWVSFASETRSLETESPTVISQDFSVPASLLEILTPVVEPQTPLLVAEASETNFVIDVWSSTSSNSVGDAEFRLVSTETEASHAYYVADQLNRNTSGWSGERLPF